MSRAAGAVIVLGMGNLVRSDDGVGVHAIQRLQHDPRVGQSVELLDGGTQGLDLVPHIAGAARLLVIDAIDAGAEPGTVMQFEQQALAGLPGSASVHQLGFADLMVALSLLEEAQPQFTVIGVQPLSTEWSTELTAPVRDALPALLDAVIAQLSRWKAA